ncbi:MAG TPA: PilN domain-containing protein [Solirubrobacterales bacterium]|jgi:Tfp pilus assembly protein PilN|nr:PilN domain-containing protein [Solirubrobacterales bacterium]
MRPVNLIPSEDRHGEHRPMRSGPVVYIVVGALVAALAGVTALVLTGNQIADRKAEAAQLRQEDSATRASAQRLAAYSQFQSLKEQRVATVTSLADSRFAWERVMRELSQVLPNYVWLTSLTATDSPKVSVGSGSSGGGSGSSSGAGMRASIAGPALEMSGCATGQDGVAGFVTALKEIDGVTRVGVQSSALPGAGSGAGVSTGGGGSGSGGGGGSSDCRTRGFIAQFHIVVAFDAAPIPSTGAGAEGAGPAAPAAAAAPAPESSGSSTTASTTTAPGG